MKRYSRVGLAVLFFLGILFCASVPGQGATGGFYAEDVFSEANSLSGIISMTRPSPNTKKY